jgi:hypothetical protein
MKENTMVMYGCYISVIFFLFTLLFLAAGPSLSLPDAGTLRTPAMPSAIRLN